jgi:hypothetical protein
MIPFLIILVIAMQSAIVEVRLKFRNYLNTGGHISHRQMLSKDVINFEGKKILVRPSQAETTKGKNVIIDESREKTRSTIKKLKPTFDELSAKYKKDDAHTKIGKHGEGQIGAFGFSTSGRCFR